MACVNRVMLLGNLTRDPDLKTVGESVVANTGLAMNRKWRDGSGKLCEEVTFVDLEIWGKQAETAKKFLAKGSPLFIEGRLKLNRWKTEGGQERQRIVVSVEKLTLVGKRPDGSGQNADGSHEQPEGGE